MHVFQRICTFLTQECHLNEGAQLSGHQPLSAKPISHQLVPKPSTHFLLAPLAFQLSKSFDSIAPLVELNVGTNSFLLNAEKS